MFWKRLLTVVSSILLAVSLTAPAPTLAQDELTAVTTTYVHVRGTPSMQGDILTVLPTGTQVVVEGRDDTQNWALVHAPDESVRGWISLRFLTLSRAVRISDLPVVSLDSAPAQSGPPTPPPERTDYPILDLTPAAAANVRAIYQRGQQLGNSPDSFMKIGDSNMAGTVFLCTFQYGNYDLGTHQDLQPLIDTFNQTQSFCRDNVSARSGFSTANELDSTWTDSPDCQPNETPLMCAYRLTSASYAFMYIGIADMAAVDAQEFETNLSTVVQSLSDNGVIPIMNTFSTSDIFNDGKPQAFDEVIRHVAAVYHLPLIDVRVAVFNYDNRGCGPDGYHLSYRDPQFTSFAGEEQTYGRPMRELLSLQMLQQLDALVNS